MKMYGNRRALQAMARHRAHRRRLGLGLHTRMDQQRSRLHPKPVDVHEATRNWLDRRAQLYRKQWSAPGSYEAYLHAKNTTRFDVGDGDLVSDTWDNGKLWRMHMIRKQAAFDITTTIDHGIYVPEQDIDDWLMIHEDQQLGRRRPFNRVDSPVSRKPTGGSGRAAIRNVHGATHLPTPAATTVRRTDHKERDWDFFYRSHLAPPARRVASSLL